MEYCLKLFASLKEDVGQATIKIELPAGITVAALIGAFAVQYGLDEVKASRIQLAANLTHLMPTEKVPPEAELALFPPVSGG